MVQEDEQERTGDRKRKRQTREDRRTELGGTMQESKGEGETGRDR